MFPAHEKRERECSFGTCFFYNFSTKRSKRRKDFTKMDLLSVGKSSGLTGKNDKRCDKAGRNFVMILPLFFSRCDYKGGYWGQGAEEMEQRAGNRGQGAEDREQRAGSRGQGQRAGGRGQGAEAMKQRAGSRGQGAEGRGRGQGAEGREQRA